MRLCLFRSVPLALCWWIAATAPGMVHSQTPVPTTSAEQVGEVRAGSGVLKGYLDPRALPDSLALLPPPPAPGSAAAAADEAAYQASRALVGSARWQMASRDVELRFPQAGRVFECALGARIDAAQTPHLVMLLRRSLADAGLATYRAKDHYQRARPFVVHQASTCSPAEEPRLVKDGSYPSGHAALGWAWALVLTELAPERSNALLLRGHAFGDSRSICGVHWHSDVEQGRVVGAAAVARLRADATYRAQLALASEELIAQRARGAVPATEDCAAEVAALRR